MQARYRLASEVRQISRSDNIDLRSLIARRTIEKKILSETFHAHTFHVSLYCEAGQLSLMNMRHSKSHANPLSPSK